MTAHMLRVLAQRCEQQGPLVGDRNREAALALAAKCRDRADLYDQLESLWPSCS